MRRAPAPRAGPIRMAYFDRHTARAALPLSRPPRVRRPWMALISVRRKHFIRERFGAENASDSFAHKLVPQDFFNSESITNFFFPQMVPQDPARPTTRDRPGLPSPPFFLALASSFPLHLRPFFYSSLQLLSRGGVISIGHHTHILALTLTTKITTVTSVRRRDETKRLNVYARLDFLNSRKQLSCEFN